MTLSSFTAKGCAHLRVRNKTGIFCNGNYQATVLRIFFSPQRLGYGPMALS